ncbi:RNA polymerase factor sigma-54 [Falsibacillus albus]|uniref:RNA polymerase sigma-54 factor n=1 Tax=Falsibacillus albus TaxID=2478915 RepID=A0A3L7K3U2_9BACI|nr:RNA polymerase factor sigma-54 [Falsibacillus albus]RLQ96681.1 RNA polymerase sigma-54 factor [Falsibacillus albus]
MNLKAGLWQQQTLKLSMTQELSQAIALLQYSTQELVSFLEQKALENPFIQMEAPNIQLMDPRHDRLRKTRIHKPDKTKQEWLEQVARKTTSIQDYLSSQLIMKALSNKQKMIINQLLYNLDSNGYLAASLDEIERAADAAPAEVNQCLRMIQQLEPAGVGARSLQECLMLQLERKGDVPPLAAAIIEDHFQEFAEKKWKPLSKKLSCSMASIQEVSDYIRTLSPRPGAEYSTEPSPYVIPELIVQVIGGSIELRMNDGTIPAIQFQKEYYHELSKIRDPQLKSFIKEKSQDFRFLMKSLRQRHETMMKVGMALVEFQSEFFLKGSKYLKPLTMKQMSEEIQVHESTVSRAVREKYIQTPFGTFELKYFFSAALETDADQTSSNTVKNLISEWIDQEDKGKPISDQMIADQLKREGIRVSRRTVAKYRDQLGILSSSKRKRFDE